MAGAGGGDHSSVKAMINLNLRYNEEIPSNLERITTRNEYYALTGRVDFYDQKIYVKDDQRKILFIFIVCGLEYEIEDVLYYSPAAYRSNEIIINSSESGSETEAPESEPELANGPSFANPEELEQYMQRLRQIAPSIYALSDLSDEDREAYLEGFMERLLNREQYIEKVIAEIPDSVSVNFFNQLAPIAYANSVMEEFDKKDREIIRYMELFNDDYSDHPQPSDRLMQRLRQLASSFTKPGELDQYMRRLRQAAPDIEFLRDYSDEDREEFLRGFMERIQNPEQYIEKVIHSIPHDPKPNQLDEIESNQLAIIYFYEKDLEIIEYMERHEQQSPSLLSFGLHVV